MAVIEHRPVGKPGCILGHQFEILKVCCHHSPHAFGIKTFEQRLCDRAADLRLGSCSEFVNQDHRPIAAARQKGLHVAQMRRVGAEVVLYRLVVAYIDKYGIENAERRV